MPSLFLVSPPISCLPCGEGKECLLGGGRTALLCRLQKLLILRQLTDAGTAAVGEQKPGAYTEACEEITGVV
jgi:hypothetical protein